MSFLKPYEPQKPTQPTQPTQPKTHLLNYQRSKKLSLVVLVFSNE